MVQMELKAFFPALKALFETRVFTNPEKRVPVAILEYYGVENPGLISNLHVWQPIIKAEFKQDLFCEALLELQPILPNTISQELDSSSKHLFVTFSMTHISLFGYLRGSGEHYVPEVRPRIKVLLSDMASRPAAGVCFILRYPDLAYWAYLMKDVKNRVLAQDIPFLKWEGSETD